MTSNDFRLERNVELSKETKAIAEEELRETPERVKEALERLRELLKENKDLYFGDDDEILTIFLRPCKWYPESAIALYWGNVKGQCISASIVLRDTNKLRFLY
ncbi:unnamed protein product [Pieris macdunnoughi]|uniref:Uncharacterized protein n=1 Tax=Pieris macdunnoughi TaxID=345717 RepID=A0A821NDF2_9NEOP|nr:unnamed protein product [Pieris macdunnoughi]